MFLFHAQRSIAQNSAHWVMNDQAQHGGQSNSCKLCDGENPHIQIFRKASQLPQDRPITQ